MRRIALRLAFATVVAVMSLGGVYAGVQSAAALPPCEEENPGCSGQPEPSPDDDGDGGGTPNPTAQPRPPAPVGTPKEFGVFEFAAGLDSQLIAGLQAPAPPGNEPWPLDTVPFSPEVAGDPVKVVHVPNTLIWVFVSFDKGGRAVQCFSTCGDTPAMVFNHNYGTYQATMRMRPRLDVELWTPVLGRRAEVTATLHVRAFAECNGWETGNGKLKLMVGADNLTIERDTGVLEDIADATFYPGVTAEVNNAIRAGLMTALGVGRYAAGPGHGDPCHSLGVGGDAFNGAIRWNDTCGKCSRPWRTGSLPVLTLT